MRLARLLLLVPALLILATILVFLGALVGIAFAVALVVVVVREAR